MRLHFLLMAAVAVAAIVGGLRASAQASGHREPSAATESRIDPANQQSAAK